MRAPLHPQALFLVSPNLDQSLVKKDLSLFLFCPVVSCFVFIVSAAILFTTFQPFYCVYFTSLFIFALLAVSRGEETWPSREELRAAGSF